VDAQALDRLRQEMEGAAGPSYLITIRSDLRLHCGVVAPTWDATGTRLLAAAPSSWPDSAAAALVNVTLLFPPDAPDGYTLIIDGVAAREVLSDGSLEITVTRAVRHRRGESASGSMCTSDCIPILDASSSSRT
jgi:hypothetical protein